MNRTLRTWLMLLGVLVLFACGPRPGGVGVPGTPVNLTIRVVDAVTQQGISGARVSLSQAGQPSFNDVASDANGIALFSGVLSGDGYKASAGSVTGYSPGASPSIKLEQDLEVLVALTPGQGAGLVVGSVKDGRTSMPLPGVTVSLNPLGLQQASQVFSQRLQPNFRVRQVGSSVTTDAAGQFTFEQVPPGSYQASFQVNAQTPVLRPVTVSSSEVTTIETVFIGGTPTGGNGSGGQNPATRGQILVAEAGRAMQLARAEDGSSRVVWTFPSSGITCVTRLGDNNLVSDGLNNQVKIVGPNGNVIWDMGSSLGLVSRLRSPDWVSAARDGASFLITDRGNNRILEVVGQQPGWSFEQGLNQPRSATYVPGTPEPGQGPNILIADTGNRRVIEVNASTKQVVWSYSDPQSLSAPSHAIRLSDGNTLITDAGFNRVIMINPAKQPVWFFDDNGGLLRPRSTTPTSFGTYLIADTENNRVLEVDRNKTIVGTVPNLARPLVLERL